MPRLSSPLRYIRALIVREDPVADVDEEIQFHIDSRAALLSADGMSPQEAVRTARRRFGNVQRVREECRMINFKRKRASDRAEWLSSLWQDVRFGLRTLGKRPLFTGVAVVTLALGIGATTGIFTLANWLLLRPVPGVHDPRRVGVAQFVIHERGGVSPFSLSYLNHPELMEGVPALSHLSGYANLTLNVSSGERPLRTDVTFVMADYFNALGVVPQLGRSFAPDEDGIGATARVTVISNRLWELVFNGSDGALGGTIRLNGVAFTVIGVAPPEFGGTGRLDRVDLWLPGSTYPLVNHLDEESARDLIELRGRGVFNMFVARLAPGATFEQAREQLRVAALGLAEAYPKQNAVFRDGSAEIHEGIGTPVMIRSHLASTVRLLMGAVTLVLLIACANVANLLIFRGVARRGEHAVRKALGASVTRLARMHIIESVILALAGGAVGIAVALGLVRLFDGTSLFGSPLTDVSLDWRVLAFTLGISLVTGLLFGVAPAAAAARVEVVAWLNDASPTRAAGRLWLQKSLTVLQLTACLILLVGTLLFTQTLQSYRNVELGFEPAGVSAFTIDPTDIGYSDVRKRSYYSELLRRTRELPGVEAAGLSLGVPLAGVSNFTLVHRTGEDPEISGVQVRTSGVTSGYFEVLRIPIRSGRGLEEREFLTAVASTHVPVILNEKLATELFGESSAIGRQLTLFRDPGQFVVVGVVGDSRWWSLNAEIEPFLYVPLDRGRFWSGSANLIVRSRLRHAMLANAVEEIAASLDNALPFSRSIRLAETIDRVLAEERLFVKILSLLAPLALFLAVVGLYGVVANSVAQRTKEFGIRLAMGSERKGILRMVLLESVRHAGLGILLGFAGAIALTRLVESRLFGVSALEPTFYLISAAGLALVAMVAAWLPARAATRVDPVTALRNE